MGYPKEVYDRAWETLSRRKQDTRDLEIARRDEISRVIPEISRIEADMARTAAGVARTVITEPDRAAQRVEELRMRNLALQDRRSGLLREKGYPADYLAEQHFCKECRDSGYIGPRMCTCLQDLLKKSAYTQLGSVSQAKRSTFADFSLSYYPDRPLDDSGIVPRQRMGQIFDLCLHYAQNFSTASDSMLFLGQTGLGKTHLSLAIASAATEAGFGVVYTPVQRLMDRLENDKFSRSSEAKEQYSDNLDHILGCDLLILDDLGTEFHTQFTTSVLYNVINSRLVEGRPTIISTNLELAQIEEKYSQRMISRLVCSYRVLKFFGKDIRFMKKQAGG